MFPEVLGPFWAHAHRVQDRFAVVKGLEMHLPMSGSEPDPLLESSSRQFQCLVSQDCFALQINSRSDMLCPVAEDIPI